jgi:hypothetical protein
MSTEPRLERSRFTIRQQANRVVPLEIDQDRPVAIPFSPCKIINAQNLWRGDGRSGRVTQETKHRPETDWQPKNVG